MLHRAYIGIGSNQGAKRANCERALRSISGVQETRLVAQSSLFESEPWGTTGEWYINGAAAVDTHLEPWPLIVHCQAIEAKMGRRRTNKRWEDRIIDLDLLLFDDRIIEDPWLEVPHPRLHQRKFVLMPLVEIAPESVHPVLGMTMRQLLARVEDEGQVYPVSETELRS